MECYGIRNIPWLGGSPGWHVIPYTKKGVGLILGQVRGNPSMFLTHQWFFFSLFPPLSLYPLSFLSKKLIKTYPQVKILKKERELLWNAFCSENPAIPLHTNCL